MAFNSFKIYALVISFIAVWWILAFREHPNTADISSIPKTEPSEHSIPLPIAFVDRATLKEALSGNLPLIAQLILEWDIDAQILQNAGMDAKRLPQHELLESQLYRRNQASLLNIEKLSSIIDDAGKSISLERPFRRFLPETYAAASFLLALVPPQEIVALPGLLREQIQLYPKSLTDQISLDIERHNSEKLFQAQPEIAFIAHYSHPATIQALANQGVVLYMMRNLSTISDITAELINIGYITNRPAQAKLMKIFIDAAMIAIDNRLLFSDPNIKILFLNYHQKFTIPTQRTLSGQLLKRLGNLDISQKYISENDQIKTWMVPIDKEHILNLNPDCLIIATENPEGLEKEIRNDPALSKSSALRNNRLFFVDEAIQQTPTQYLVLSYFDIVQQISRLP